jgi:hypothetical protein
MKISSVDVFKHSLEAALFEFTEGETRVPSSWPLPEKLVPAEDRKKGDTVMPPR